MNEKMQMIEEAQTLNKKRTELVFASLNRIEQHFEHVEKELFLAKREVQRVAAETNAITLLLEQIKQREQKQDIKTLSEKIYELKLEK